LDIYKAKSLLKNKILKLNTKKNDNIGIIRISIKINDDLDPLVWLSMQDSDKKIYWKDRELNLVCAGIGECIGIYGDNCTSYKKIFSEIRQYLTSNTQIRFYGGMRFPYSRIDKNLWRDFGYYYFLVPLFEIIKNKQGTYLVCNIKTPVRNINDIIYELDKITADIQSLNFSMNTRPMYFEYISKTHIPTITQWEHDVTDMVEDIKNNKLIKIVLARQTIFQLKYKFDVFYFLMDKKWKKEKSYQLLIQLNPSVLFIGMPPERIYFRNHRHIETEAIAGTRGRGRSENEDNILSQELKNSDKELQEHRLVSNTLKHNISCFCSSINTEYQENILRLSYMQHLYTKFSGTLLDGVSDDIIISTLYPNAAIAGYPLEKALIRIKEVERFDRGWYSGPFGWISYDSAEFVVAIRSALIKDNFLYLYAGAGLVDGSDAENEWKELDNKILNFSHILKNAS